MAINIPPVASIMIEGIIIFGVIYGVIFWVITWGGKKDKPDLTPSGSKEPPKREPRASFYEEKARAMVVQFGEESLNSFTDNRPHGGDEESTEAIMVLHIWKRAIALVEIYSEKGRADEDQFQTYRWLSIHIARAYQKMAPRHMRVSESQRNPKFVGKGHVFPMPYGEPQLSISGEQLSQYKRRELRRLFPENFALKDRPLACVYMGTDPATGKSYVGQTMNAPEQRQLEHRKNGSGPFKEGAAHVNWEILKENVPPAELDYWESFYIGVSDSFKRGFNSNHGEDRNGYSDGIDARVRADRS